MSVINTRQISKSNNKTKLIEFNDRLQHNNFSEETGVCKSTVHSKYSRIQAVIVDWTAGKKDKAVVVTHNISPINIKLIAEMVLKGNISCFKETDRYSKKIGYFEQKIDFRKKNKDGCSPVTTFNIRYQEKMNSPWTITIENGIGIASISQIGGVSIKAGSYKKINNSSVYLSETEMAAKMIEIKDYIFAYETVYMRKMLAARKLKEKEFKEKREN